MIRRIIKINEDLCNGCGACADACHEGAIAMVDGKARLIKDDYCDGLGDCLPTCPTGAITFEEREAAAYDEAAVKARMHQSRNLSPSDAPLHRECPESRLTQWPVQIKLAPVQAPYFKDARLLIAAWQLLPPAQWNLAELLLFLSDHYERRSGCPVSVRF